MFSANKGIRMKNISGIVGLDLSITGSGVARWDCIENCNSNLRTVGTKPSYGLIMERLRYSAMELINIVEKDDIVFIEDYAFGVRPGISRLASLAELGGIIKFLVYRKTGKPTIQVSSTSVKKWLSGSGRLPHSDFKLVAYKKYATEFATKDEVIAYSIVDFGLHLLFPPKRKLFEYEEQVITNFRKKHPEINDFKV